MWKSAVNMQSIGGAVSILKFRVGRSEELQNILNFLRIKHLVRLNP